MIKAILFDFDDTLISRRYAAYQLYKEMLTEFTSMDPSTIQFEAVLQDVVTWDQYGNMDKSFVKQRLLDKYHLDLGIESFNDYWAKNVYRYTQLMPGAKDLLEHLKGTYKLGVITNGDSYGQGKKIEQSQIGHYFDTIVISDEFGVHKPDPSIYLEACNLLQVLPSEAVYVGDTFSNDIYGAIHAGLDAVWIWPHESRLCDYHVHRINKLDELEEVLKKMESEDLTF